MFLTIFDSRVETNVTKRNLTKTVSGQKWSLGQGRVLETER